MNRSRTAFLLLGLFVLWVYIRTLAPTITWRNGGVDSGDFATAVAVGGVPHPPGYPTYLLLGEVFKWLPVGDIAYRLNLLSAVCAALTVTILGLISYQILSETVSPGFQANNNATKWLSWYCAGSAALILAFSATFWSQAVITEVYALNALFVAGLLYLILQLKPSNERWLIPAIFGFFGLGLGNHLSLLLLLPLFIWLLKDKWHGRFAVPAILAFGTGLLIYLMIPLRAAAVPPVNWGGAATWPDFYWLVSATLYRRFVFSLPWQLVPVRILSELRLLTESLMWWGLPVALLGWYRLAQFQRSLGYGSLATFFVISIYAIGYNTTDSYVYLLPALLIVSIWLSVGLYELGQSLERFRIFQPSHNYVVISALILLPLFSLWLNFSDQNISQDYEAYTYGRQTLDLVEPNGIIITDSDPHTFALWYSRYGLGLRPDVAVVNIHLISYAWYRHTLSHTHANVSVTDPNGQPLTSLPAFIQHNSAESPIYLATLQPVTLPDYELESLESLKLVTRLKTQ